MGERGLTVHHGSGWVSGKRSGYRGGWLRRSGQWVPAVPQALDNIDGVGIASSYASVNRLAVASEATLLSHAGADHQLKINKAAIIDSANLLFQKGFDGRSEMGITGSDDFEIKVSPDGTTFSTGAAFDGVTEEASFPNDARVSGTQV